MMLTRKINCNKLIYESAKLRQQKKNQQQYLEGNKKNRVEKILRHANFLIKKENVIETFKNISFKLILTYYQAGENYTTDIIFQTIKCTLKCKYLLLFFHSSFCTKLVMIQHLKGTETKLPQTEWPTKGWGCPPRSAKVVVKQELYFLPSSSCIEALANVVHFEQAWQ